MTCFFRWCVGWVHQEGQLIPEQFAGGKNPLLQLAVDPAYTPLTFREERRLRVFENRVLRRIFGPERDEVTREWRKLRNEELSDLYSTPNIFGS